MIRFGSVSSLVTISSRDLLKLVKLGSQACRRSFSSLWPLNGLSRQACLETGSRVLTADFTWTRKKKREKRDGKRETGKENPEKKKSKSEKRINFDIMLGSTEDAEQTTNYFSRLKKTV